MPIFSTKKKTKKKKSGELPAQQESCLRTVLAFTDQNGFPPSLTEIAEIMGVQKPTAQSHVGKLVDKGFLVRRWPTYGGKRLLCGQRRLVWPRQPE